MKYELTKHYDLFFCKKYGCLHMNCLLVSTINSEFESFGISAIDDSNGIVQGRPYGGMGILKRKSYRKHAEFHNFNESRILDITLCIDNLQYDFISVYMPYQCDENYDLYMECICKLSTLIEESCTNNIVILGDFNATLNSVFEGELLEMCSTFDLVISDYNNNNNNNIFGLNTSI